jgi:hypothetical protein
MSSLYSFHNVKAYIHIVKQLENDFLKLDGIKSTSILDLHVSDISMLDNLILTKFPPIERNVNRTKVFPNIPPSEWHKRIDGVAPKPKPKPQASFSISKPKERVVGGRRI